MPEFNAQNLLPDSRVHCLMVGPSGTGKTAAACSWGGEDSKTYILDFDDRAQGAIEGCDFLQPKRRKGNIVINRILPWIGKAEQGLKQVYDVLEPLDEKVTRGEIQNVICDGTTSMRRFFINEALNRGLNTSGKGSTLKHFAIGEAIMPGKPDHNYAAVCMTNIIYDILKTFKCNVFISTHLTEKFIPSPTEEDPDRVISVGETITAPGQLQTEIPSWFNEAWEFSVDASVKSKEPQRIVTFKGKWARTSFRELGEMSGGKWEKRFKLDITGKALYEVLRPTLDRMKVPPPQVPQVVSTAK